MHLIAPLAAGVKGAENGTAEIYERGTTTRSGYYLTFEADSGTSSADVALDSHGGAVVYVTHLCNVAVKNSEGAILREFVAGDRDDAVEVQSQSFTGTNYDGSFTAPDQPTTLAAVLDSWFTVNHGIDWQVGVPGGGSLPISNAIAGSYGLVFSVKAYGAAGDGVANDTNAIISAINAAVAAGGGLVYFPPGTYRNTGFTATNYGNVSLIGAGPAATSLVLDNLSALTLLTLGAPTVTDRFSICANMRLSSLAPAGANMLRVRDGARYLLHNLFVDGTNCSTDAVVVFGADTAELLASECIFMVPLADPAIDNSPNTVFPKRLVFRDCKFITGITAGTEIIDGNNIELLGCHFINTAASSGSFACIKAAGAGQPDLRVIGCKFSSSSGAAVTAIDIGTYDSSARVHEAGNIFGSGVTAYNYTATAAARGAQIALLSRELRSIFVTDNGAAPILPIDQYGIVVLSSTNNALVFAATKQPPDGARGTIVLFHPAPGGAGTAIAGANFLNPASAVTAANSGHVWEYRVCTPAAAVRMALTVDGRSLGATL